MQSVPTVEVQMLVRKSSAEVFNAFIDPAITTHFWFTKSSGKLETGKPITWTWEMYDFSTKVFVKDIIPTEKIIIEWNEPVTTVEFHFNAVTADTTYVVIKNYGFNCTGEELIAKIKDNTGGFTTVIDGLKVYLEHGIDPNLIADKFPNI
jgi:uncharacterized protein YndB with AHSA1/START domain